MALGAPGFVDLVVLMCGTSNPAVDVHLKMIIIMFPEAYNVYLFILYTNMRAGDIMKYSSRDT
jgi:hypothetical protein